FISRDDANTTTLPEALSCLHSFITLKNIRTLLCVTLFYFGIAVTKQIHHRLPLHLSARHPPTSPKVAYPIDTSTFSPSVSPHNNTTSKYRDCSIQYK
ncbi:hypothetical protein BD770DRAFT_311778, partial [Pilaira anomala]